MRLLDSNIIIYAADFSYTWLADWIDLEEFRTSVMTKVEVLGYHKQTESQVRRLKPFFQPALVIPLSKNIEELAITLRCQKNMGLGDALIAATALEFDLELVTRNVKDFSWISDLRLLNPFDSEAA